MVSGFGRLCWEGLAVCLTGPFLLSSVRLAFEGGAVGEGVGGFDGGNAVVLEIRSWSTSVCVRIYMACA
jgi:hypothetical protein